MTSPFQQLLRGVAFFSVFVVCGCVRVPKPETFLNSTDSVERALWLEQYRAHADGKWLTIDVNPRNAPFRGLEFFEAGGDLYFSTRFDGIFFTGNPIDERHVVSLPFGEVVNNEASRQSNGKPAIRFKIDTSKYGLAADWSSHVYWVIEQPVYPIWDRGYWSKKDRAPLSRRQMSIVR